MNEKIYARNDKITSITVHYKKDLQKLIAIYNQ